jgi:hypothetical protein
VLWALARAGVVADERAVGAGVGWAKAIGAIVGVRLAYKAPVARVTRVASQSIPHCHMEVGFAEIRTRSWYMSSPAPSQ